MVMIVFNTVKRNHITARKCRNELNLPTEEGGGLVVCGCLCVIMLHIFSVIVRNHGMFTLRVFDLLPVPYWDSLQASLPEDQRQFYTNEFNKVGKST